MATYQFGSTSEDFGSQYADIGGANSPTILVYLEEFTLITPVGGIRITELRRGMKADPLYAGYTFNMMVYDITDSPSISGAPLLGQATINVVSVGNTYVWHEVTGLDIQVPANRKIALATTPTSGPVWTSRREEAASYYNDGTSETVGPSPWPSTSLGLGRIVPLQAGYELLNAAATIDSINGNTESIRLTSPPHPYVNTINTSGIGTLTEVTVAGIPVTNLTLVGDGTDATFTMPDCLDRLAAGTMPRFGIVQVVATGTLGQASRSASLLPWVGWQHRQLLGPSTTQFSAAPPGAVGGGQIVHPDHFPVDFRGFPETDFEGTARLWYISPSNAVDVITVTTGSGAPPPTDTVPNPFTVPAVTGVGLNEQVTSAQVTPTGYDAPAAISVVGGLQYAIGAGAYTAAAGTINPGQSFTLRRTSAGTNSTESLGTVTIGGVAASWSVTTIAAAGQPGDTNSIKPPMKKPMRGKMRRKL